MQNKNSKKGMTPLQAVIDSTEQFSAHFYKTLAKNQPENFISSPLSANVVLSMASFGAKENTKKQMNDILIIPTDETLAKPGYKNLIDSLNSVEGVELKLANKIFPNENLEVKKEFLDLTKEIFLSEAQQLDFADNQESANVINSWCEDKTNKKIKDLIKPSDLSADTAMVLVNAVYFKGQWINKFDANKTTDREFHINGQTVKKVPTMHQTENIFYGQLPNQKAKFVEIPYNGDKVSMVIVLPDEMCGLETVEKELGKMNPTSLTKDGHYEDVILYLPKFKIESNFDLQDVLTKMGMGEIFTDQANFRNIADADLKVSKVVQKAFIEVNEEGAEAAAATAMVMCTMAFPGIPPPQPPVFDVNRPFLYYIVYDTDKNNYYSNKRVVLFSGHVTDPQKKI